MDETDFQVSIAGQRLVKEKALAQTSYRKALCLTDKKARFPGFNQHTVNYHAGQQVHPGALTLPTDIVLHKSVPMTLTDGVTLYSDIFLPGTYQDISERVEHAERVPALIAWSVLGFRGTSSLT